MARRRTANVVVDESRHTWKKRPSEIHGYQRAYYMTTDDNDYVRVDFNLREKRVRLYVEIDGEGGNAYYAVISNGKITAERSVSSGRSFGFADKFRERADIFATLPNREVLKLINRNYGIGKAKLKGKPQEQKTEKEKLIEETKRRYFKPEFHGTEEERKVADDRRLFRKIRLFDVIDMIVGCAVSAAAFWYFKYSFLALGAVAAFFGIIIGMVDMFFRDRSPLFIKVGLFLMGGTAAYVYGYFY